MIVVHSKRQKRNKQIGYVEAFSSFLNVYEHDKICFHKGY